MIDLTPLDVRKKRGDFRRTMRGYLPEEVDAFLDLVALRMEELVRENMALRERSELLQVQVDAQTGRERAVQEALVTAQAMRDEMKEQSRREADLSRREAEVEARRIMAEADRRLEERRAALEDMERKRARFLRSFRALLEREMDVVVVEEGRSPLEDRPVDLELSGGRPAEPAHATSPSIADPADVTVLDASDVRGVEDADLPGDLWLSTLADGREVPRPRD